MLISVKDRKILEDLPPEALSLIGIDQIAYVRKVMQEDTAQPGYAVYAADGRRLCIMDSFETAENLIRMNDLQPVTVH